MLEALTAIPDAPLAADIAPDAADIAALLAPAATDAAPLEAADATDAAPEVQAVSVGFTSDNKD